MALTAAVAVAATAAATPALAGGRPSARAAAGGLAGATPGTLDPSFGTGGLVTTPAGAGDPANIVPLPDGKFLVLTTVTDPSTGNSDIGVLRYAANGTLDPSFGTGGEALASFPASDAFAGTFASALFVQPNGQIVAVGGVGPAAGGPSQSAVVRFNANGTLDTSFGSGGEVTTQYPSPIGTGIDSANTVLVQPDGKILVGGGVQGTSCNPRKNCVTDTVLARYNSNGTLDTTFGSGGFAEVNAESFGITAVSEDASGDIFVQNGIGGGQPTLGEYSPAGTPDATVTFPSSSAITASSSNGFQPNGTYAVGRSVKLTSNTFSATAAQVVIKSLPAGAVFPGFSNPPFDFANESGSGINNIQGIAFQANGDVVAAGMRCPGTGRNACSSSADQIGVARLTSTGGLDTTFGAGGVTTIATGDEVTALAIAANGDILVAFQDSAGSSIARVLG
jgi:uncharacterized delta-60 repeat protein